MAERQESLDLKVTIGGYCQVMPNNHKGTINVTYSLFRLIITLTTYLAQFSRPAWRVQGLRLPAPSGGTQQDLIRSIGL